MAATQLIATHLGGDALVWLSGQFIASVMSTEVEVLNCTAAIYDADTEEVTVQWHGTSDELADLLDRLAK